jgi:hypothetical protein
MSEKILKRAEYLFLTAYFVSKTAEKFMTGVGDNDRFSIHIIAPLIELSTLMFLGNTKFAANLTMKQTFHSKNKCISSLKPFESMAHVLNKCTLISLHCKDSLF